MAAEMKETKTAAVTVRLDQDLKDRLACTAERLDLSENYIVRHAIELPLELVLKKVPAVSHVERGAMSAIRRAGRAPTDIALNEPPGNYGSGKKRKE
jgi:predicted transcriptional regulator